MLTISCLHMIDESLTYILLDIFLDFELSGISFGVHHACFHFLSQNPSLRMKVVPHVWHVVIQ